MSARLLIVEDDTVTAAYLRDVLHALGYTVAGHVISGEDAIQKAGELQPDLVLMDILLAGNVDGIAATKQITSLYNIPVVLLSAYANESTIRRAVFAHPSGFVMKPFEETGLRAAIELALHRHRDEQKFHQIQQQWAVTVQALADAVISADATGRITMMNAAAETLTGWKQEEALGKTLSDVFNVVNDIADDSSPFADSFVESSMRPRGGRPQLISKDGTNIHIDYSSTVVRDSRKNIEGFLVLARNVTAQKRLEDALNLSRKRYKELVNSIDGIVWESDTETGRFHFVSRQAERILGYPVSLWLNDPNFWRERVHEEDREKVFSIRSEAIKNRTDYDCEYRMLADTGQLVWLRDHGSVSEEKDGALKLRGVMIPITK